MWRLFTPGPGINKASTGTHVCAWTIDPLSPSLHLSCFAVPCCAVSCCAVLCCDVLCCAVVCCAVLRRVVLICSVLCCAPFRFFPRHATAII